ncbi:ATP-binding protein [Halorientalis pallida]|uniref:ATP-binding protein n=1 Tax=Halorientalis pallida TaxID=2479928 RepID=UPI003C6F4EEB
MAAQGVPAVTALSLCSAVAFAAVAIRAARRRPGAGAQWFAATIGLLAVGAAGTAVAYYSAGTVDLATGIYPLIVVVMPVVWARFAFEYYGLFEFTSRRRTVALIAPAVVAALAGTWVGLVEVGLFPTVSETLVLSVYSGYVAMHFYSATVLLVAVGLLVRTSLRRDHLGLSLGGALAVIVLGPWVGNFIHGAFRVTDTTVPGVADEMIRVGAIAVGAVAAVAAVSRYRLFEGLPAAGTIGPETVLEEMDDLVVVTDRAGRVVRLNERARRAFADDGAPVDRTIDDVLGTSVDALADRDGVRLDTTTGPRQFDPSVSELTNEQGHCIGHALVFRDVTERYTRRQRLSVLNRVLRHNLRNETATIVTRAEVIAEQVDDDTAGLADEVVDTALSIAETGDKARRIERMMAVPVTPDPRTDVASVVRDVVDTIREETGCAVSWSAPEGVVARADHRVLHPVLEDLVENAVEHNDAVDPTVDVSVTVDPEADLPVEITVTDDGPGIPESERSPVVDGAEAPLEHGSGLGLWGVKWGVTRMGGSLTFEDNDPRGTIVRVRVPTPADADDAAAVDEAVAQTEVPPRTPPAVPPGTIRDLDASTDGSS